MITVSGILFVVSMYLLIVTLLAFVIGGAICLIKYVIDNFSKKSK
jgi:hypothetical protein